MTILISAVFSTLKLALMFDFKVSRILYTLNIEFPSLQRNYVFMGEVSFLTGADDCEQWPPELINETNYLQNSTCMLDVKYIIVIFTGLTDELTSTTESSTTSYPPSISSSAPR